MMYEPITCGTCGKCVTEWLLVEGGPFAFVKNEPLKTTLERTCGLCMDWKDEPVVVMLDTDQDDMPCGGTEWVPKEDSDGRDE